MTATSTHVAADWLAATAPDPERVHREWLAQGLALLPVGVRWDAVRILDDGTGHAWLAEIGGPVAYSPSMAAHHVLVPPRTNLWWRAADTECIGFVDGYSHYLGLPAPDRLGRPGEYWVIPPDGSGRLVNAEHLHRVLLVHAAAQEDGGEDR